MSARHVSLTNVHSQSQSRPFQYLLTILVAFQILSQSSLLLSPPVVQAYPFHVIKSSRPKCIRLESSIGIRIAIDYEAPDLIILSQDDSELAALSRLQRVNNRMTAQTYGNGGRGNGNSNDRSSSGQIINKERYGKERSYGKDRSPPSQMDPYKQRDIRFENKDKKPKDSSDKISSMSITVENIDFGFHRKPTRTDGSTRIHETFDIQQEKGTLSYELSTNNGVKICVQCLNASPFKPTFVSLSVREKHDTHLHFEEGNTHTSAVQEQQKQEEEQQQKSSNANNEAKVHLNWLEKQLMDMIRQADTLDREFQHSKDHHHESFVQTSIRLNSSSTLYPKVQMFLMLLVGAYQARIIIAYLKRMRILPGM